MAPNDDLSCMLSILIASSNNLESLVNIYLVVDVSTLNGSYTLKALRLLIVLSLAAVPVNITFSFI